MATLDEIKEKAKTAAMVIALGSAPPQCRLKKPIRICRKKRLYV